MAIIGVANIMLYRYKKYLHFYRQKNERPLTIGTQRVRLTAVKMFFNWLYEQNHIPVNPAKELELPKLPQQLPMNYMSIEEVEQLLSTPDINNPIGLRNRTMMEVLYSTGIRRAEVLNLKLFDVDYGRGMLMIREGKGRKDRVVPIGKRALDWIGYYLSGSRTIISRNELNEYLFITNSGGAIRPVTLTKLMHNYLKESGVNKTGSVHIMRHTAATLMLDNGADIRHIQELLGHASLTTTQLYTHVSIKKLKAVHERTHPAG